METNYNEWERWRLESALDHANHELAEDRLILNALDTYLFAEHLGHSTAPQALEQLRALYSSIMRDRYPDGRP
jgi:hypothetical protein